MTAAFVRNMPIAWKCEAIGFPITKSLAAWQAGCVLLLFSARWHTECANVGKKTFSHLFGVLHDENSLLFEHFAWEHEVCCGKRPAQARHVSICLKRCAQPGPPGKLPFRCGLALV